jgi:hypothetical protein
MSITNDNLTELWDSLGQLHVEIDQRRQIITSIEQAGGHDPGELHLLHGLRLQLDEMDKILNQANIFVKDYEPNRIENVLGGRG